MRFRVLRPSCALRFLAVFRAISGMSSLRAHTILRCVTPRHRPFDFVLKWGLPLLSLCVCVLWACATMLDGEVVMAMPPPLLLLLHPPTGRVAAVPIRKWPDLYCAVWREPSGRQLQCDDVFCVRRLPTSLFVSLRFGPPPSYHLPLCLSLFCLLHAPSSLVCE